MNTNTKIEWCDASWNPVVGCRHRCFYCYAKRMNDRFKWVRSWENATLFPERLTEPYKLKKPSKIFVCSMADLFGEWVPKSYIESVIKVAEENPQHIFQFLTKNPIRYFSCRFPDNCWLGITIDGLEDVEVMKAKLKQLKVAASLFKKKNYTFISFEPLLGDVSSLDLKDIDLVIVGAMTGKGAIAPKEEWIGGVKHKNIFYKSNIKKYLQMI